MTSIFIEKAKNRHGDKYDYSKVEYKKAIEKVIIICNEKEHGEFEQSPSKHLSGNGCPKCAGFGVTKEKFIEKAINVHGDKYNYSKVDYKKAIEKVVIICKKHGEFEQSPNNHLKGKGCPICAGKNVSNESFIKNAMKIHGERYNYSKVEYKKAIEKVIITCYLHGDFLQTPNDHLSGNGCLQCGRISTTNSKKSNTSEFIEKARLVHKDELGTPLYDYSKVDYKKAIEKVIIICKEHGEFEQQPNNHLTGQGCEKCGIIKRAITQRYELCEFIEKANSIHKDEDGLPLYDYSKVDYNKSIEKVNIICKKHGDFEQRPGNHLQGNGCPTCAGQNVTKESFIEKAIKIHGDKYDYSNIEYKKAIEKVNIFCKEHEGFFFQTPNAHLNGHGCNICKNKTEKKLFDLLVKDYNDLECQYKREWCKNKITNKMLPYDFVLENEMIIIELDGRQHFEQCLNWSSPEEQNERDIYKMKCANEHGFSVIRLIQKDVWNDYIDWYKLLKDSIITITVNGCVENHYISFEEDIYKDFYFL